MATVTDSLSGKNPLAATLRRRHRVDRGMTDPPDGADDRHRRAARVGARLRRVQGLQAINWGFITDTPPGNPSDTGGGFANGIVGSLIIVGIATLVAVPFGIGCAIYLNQYAAGRIAHALRLVTDVMLGIPTIVTGRVRLRAVGRRVRFLGLRGRDRAWPSSWCR